MSAIFVGVDESSNSNKPTFAVLFGKLTSGGSIGGAMGAIAPPYGLKKNIFFSLYLFFITEKIVNFLS